MLPTYKATVPAPSQQPMASMAILHTSASAPLPIPPSRKRRGLPCSTPTDDATHRSQKKRKLCHPTSPPSRFWDGLSTIALTRNALRELDRRNTQPVRRKAAHLSPIRQSRRLRARQTVTTENDCIQPVDQALNRVKKFATHGGPDLSQLRGVRMACRCNNPC